MLVVQPRGLDSADEELRPIGVGSSVSHGEDAGAGVLQDEVLIGKLLAIDGLATSSIVVGEVSTLTHEVGDDTVEGGVLEADALLPGAQGTEVLSSLGHNIGTKLHDDPAEGLAVGGHIEKHSWPAHDGYSSRLARKRTKQPVCG